MSKEYVYAKQYMNNLHSLVEKGDHEAVKSFIKENQIEPVAIYHDFHSVNKSKFNPPCTGVYPSYLSFMVYEYNLLCPVGLAARCGHVQVMKTMIDAGFHADGRSASFDAIRPIRLACERGHLEVVKTLVEEYNVDITRGEPWYRRPAMCIVADNGHLEIVQYFIEKAEIPVNSRYGVNNDSALHAAAQNNRIDVCKYLISRGADVNITDDRQDSAFFKAAYNCHLKMMKLLQSRGADPELYGSCSNSPLYNAVSDNRIDIVFYLVNELNVRIESTKFCEETRQGETVCRMALREHSYDMVKLLFNAGYDPSEELAEYEDSDDDNSSKLRELRQMIARPRSLLALTVLTVRRVLGRRFPVDLDTVPLPDILKNVIVSCCEAKPYYFRVKDT